MRGRWGCGPTRARTAKAAAAKRRCATLDSFLATRAEGYRAGMSSPLTGERACSRLSPYLALGVLSVREVEAARQAAPLDRPGWKATMTSFAKRLAWRDHFIQKLEDEPDAGISLSAPGA